MINRECHGCGEILQRFYFMYKLFDVKWVMSDVSYTLQNVAPMKVEAWRVYFCVTCDEKVDLPLPIAERIPVIQIPEEGVVNG